MSDVVVSIDISDVSYSTWLRTSLVGMANIVNGVPMIETTELGIDQVDAFNNFIDEACRELLKVFVSRQGDATGAPFEKTTTTVVYRFNEEQPPLPQANSIKESLNEDVKNAIYTYITLMWFTIKKNEDMAAYLIGRYKILTGNIDNHLYKLHD
jgi:hypothetical protein